MSDRELGFGIIGCGMIANFHATALKEVEGARLIGATDVVEESRNALTEKHGGRAFASVEELLANSEVDAVCVCTPTGHHSGPSIQAARAGKHVVVEKPMALNLAQADEVIRAVESGGVKMEVISQLRFSPALHRLRRAIAEGVLGRLVAGDVYMKFYRSQEYYDSGGWRGTWEMDGGGALMNQGIHGIDALQHVMGPARSVYGLTKTLVRNIEVEDTAAAVVEWESGALGVVQGTTSVYPGYARRMEISGEQGTIVMEENVLAIWEVEGQEVPDDVNLGKASGGAARDPGAMSAAGHVLQITDLVEAVREDRKTLVDQREGRKPIEIIMAIYESSRSGRPVNIEVDA